MDLWTWPSGFGLSTWHPECLALQTYSSFCGAPVTLRPASALTPLWYSLPSFAHKGHHLHTLDALVPYLAEHSHFDLERQLSPRERSQTKAFCTLVREQLAPYTAFVLLVHEANFDAALRPWFSKQLVFPLGMFLPGQLRRSGRALCEATVGVAVTEEVQVAGGVAGEQLMESVLYIQAADAIQALSQKMSDQPYLLGKKPCTADALLFAYLGPLLRVPLPSNRMKALIQSHPNLVRFVENVSLKYYPRLSQSQGPEEERDSEPTTSKPGTENTTGSRNNNLIAAIVAVAAMAGYAYASGLYTAFRHVSIHMED